MYSLWQFFSWMGDWERVVAFGSIIFFILLYYKLRKEAVILLSVVVVSKASSILLKHFIERERPDVALWMVEATGFSFPSGHATVAMALYGGLGVILWRELKQPLYRSLAAAFCFAMVLGIGLSRIFLQVHWLTDVLGGWLLGGIVIWALMLLQKRIDSRHGEA